ncbi:MAG: IgA Peptidase M64, partial [Thermoanaerobaculales bacterium]|nr:IgA Peptidase M64 [Thermoanaerobaculales bacterium]
MRTKNLVAALALTLVVVGATIDSPFDRDFEDATLRIDYYHVGNALQEFVSIDRISRQGVWAGSRTRLADPFEYGGYLVEARDAESGDLLYSRGFDSYFGEYRTTHPAGEGTLRTYHETVLLPFPRRPIQVLLTARRNDGTVLPLTETTIDPASLEITTEPPRRGAQVVEAHIGGPPHRVLDIAILGEGYTAEEADVFVRDLTWATGTLLTFEPFASHRDQLSVRGVLVPSSEAGCDEPTRGSYRDTTLGASFNSLGSERYLLTENNRDLRDVAANVPYDALIIMINQDRYGGGGIYNLFCTFTAHSDWAGYLLLHEFGHSFGGLADEYYSSSTAYNDFYPRGREPVQPNITALLDPADLKWMDLVAPGTALPTPWEKEAYDTADAAYQKERTVLNEAIAAAVRSGAAQENIQELTSNEIEHASAHALWA